MNKSYDTEYKLLICLLLTAAILVAYWQVRNLDFVNFDDPSYVTQNAHVKEGLTVKGFTWAFKTFHASNWHPLTWLSHMVDCELYGLNPMGHHWTNLQLHIANTLLLFFVLQQMTGSLWRSAFVAALFALHPLHVESVAWIAERKDVLSTVFGMLTIFAYYRYVKDPRLISYLLVILLLSLGLMAKPMLVTLPFMLLLLDFWPLKRLQYNETCIRLRRTKNNENSPSESSHAPLWKRGAGGDFKGEVYRIPPLEKGDTGGFSGEYKLSPSNNVTGFGCKGFLGLILEKIPLFIPVAISSILTFIAQQKQGAIQSLGDLSLNSRIANAFVSYVSYVVQAVWPHHLAVFYPHPLDTLPVWQVFGAVLLVGSLSILAVRASKQYPYTAVGWFWYLGTLIPVIGLVQVADQAMADRYTYIPLIGLSIIVTWGIPDLLEKWPYRKTVLVLSGILTLSALTVCTFLQVSHWKNSITLFENAIKVTNNNWLAHNNLGIALLEKAKFDEAIFHYKVALRIKPDNVAALKNLGAALFDHGDIDEAVSYYTEALKIDPEDADAHYNLGRVLAKQGKIKQAMLHFGAAIKINPNCAEAYNEAGIILAQQRRLKDAGAFFSKAIQINPNHAEARKNRELLTTIQQSAVSHQMLPGD